MLWSFTEDGDDRALRRPISVSICGRGEPRGAPDHVLITEESGRYSICAWGEDGDGDGDDESDGSESGSYSDDTAHTRSVGGMSQSSSRAKLLGDGALGDDNSGGGTGEAGDGVDGAGGLDGEEGNQTRMGDDEAAAARPLADPILPPTAAARKKVKGASLMGYESALLSDSDTDSLPDDYLALDVGDAANTTTYDQQTQQQSSRTSAKSRKERKADSARQSASEAATETVRLLVKLATGSPPENDRSKPRSKHGGGVWDISGTAVFAVSQAAEGSDSHLGVKFRAYLAIFRFICLDAVTGTKEGGETKEGEHGGFGSSASLLPSVRSDLVGQEMGVAGVGTVVLDVRHHPSRRVRQAATAALLALVHTSRYVFPVHAANARIGFVVRGYAYRLPPRRSILGSQTWWKGFPTQFNIIWSISHTLLHVFISVSPPPPSPSPIFFQV